MVEGRVRSFLGSKYPGFVMLAGGIAWNWVSSTWKPELLFVVGSLWSIAALWLENWQLITARLPRLKLVFDQDRGAPFVRDKPLFHQNGTAAGTLRIFNVGLTNTGDTAPSVAVRVVKIEPNELSPYWTSVSLIRSGGQVNYAV